jgi:hypothetical protein
MARRIKDVTKDYLENVPLPTHGSTYTVISHKSIIDYAYQELANHGFGIVGEEYRCTHDGQIAQGIYRLQYGSDPEMSVMFAWTNSYNKKIRFKCAVGGYVSMNNTVMLSADMGSYSRKHTGSADADTIASMQSQIANATMYYNQLVQDKEEMKKVELTRKRQAELLGVLFADHQILNTEQASIVLQQMEKPSFFYNGGRDTLWAFYNHITIALQNSHPQTWMEDQRMLHMCLIDELANSVLQPDISLIEEPLLVDILDPLASNYGEPENQTNLLVQIAEVTGDDSVLWGAQHKITEDIVIHIESDQEYLERVAEIEGEPKMTELPDNQVVQNGSDFDIDLHQSDEIIEDTNEDEENVLTEDELAHQLYGVDNDIEVSIPSVDLDDEEDEDWEKLEVADIITPCAAHDVETEKEETELVQYTDPAGNTFELVNPKTNEELVAEYNATHDDSHMNIEYLSPEEVKEKYGQEIVIHVESDEEYVQRVAEIEGEPEVETKMPQEIMDALMNAPEMDVSKVDMSKVTSVDAPEVAPNRVKFAIDETEEEVEVPKFEWEEPQLAMTPEEIHEHQDEIDQIIANEVETPVVAEVPVSEPSNDLDFSLDFEDEDDDEPSSSHDFFL